jgi:uncharacterized PurR-regulated membrane protein YhhQ (DUF165 family)
MTTRNHRARPAVSRDHRDLSTVLNRRITGRGLAVVVAYIGTVVAANWASTHWPAVPVGSLFVPAGTLWAGVTFTLRDLLHDSLGGRGVAAAIAGGAGLSWLLASPQIATASVVAFTVSELLDSAAYARLSPAFAFAGGGRVECPRVGVHRLTVMSTVGVGCG